MSRAFDAGAGRVLDVRDFIPLLLHLWRWSKKEWVREGRSAGYSQGGWESNKSVMRMVMGEDDSSSVRKCSHEPSTLAQDDRVPQKQSRHKSRRFTCVFKQFSILLAKTFDKDWNAYLYTLPHEHGMEMLWSAQRIYTKCNAQNDTGLLQKVFNQFAKYFFDFKILTYFWQICTYEVVQFL